jgi:hypothetical protein
MAMVKIVFYMGMAYINRDQHKGTSHIQSNNWKMRHIKDACCYKGYATLPATLWTCTQQRCVAVVVMRCHNISVH